MSDDIGNTSPLYLSDVKSVLREKREYIKRCIEENRTIDEFLRKMNDLFGNLESSVDNFDSAMNAFIQKLDDAPSNLQQEVDQFLSILKDLHQHCHQTLYTNLRNLTRFDIPHHDDDKQTYNKIEINTIAITPQYYKPHTSCKQDTQQSFQISQPVPDTNQSGRCSTFTCTASDAEKRVADEMKSSKKHLYSMRREVGQGLMKTVTKGAEYISDLEQRLSEVELDLQTKCTEFMKEQHASEKLRLELQHKGGEIDKLKEENTKQKKKIDKLKKENSELKGKNDELKEELTKQRNLQFLPFNNEKQKI